MLPDRFLSCDWGTSVFRLRLADVSSFSVTGKEQSLNGIAKTFEDWRRSGSDRMGFYVKVIEEHIEKLEQKLNTALDGLPLIISGMASSTLGMAELPYRMVPFAVNGGDLEVRKFDLNSNAAMLISGARTGNDVMRGEETQLAGCVPSENEQVFIFPGTHSKHIMVREGKVIGFKTYMTGEFFELLSKKSILSGSVKVRENEAKFPKKSFVKGVADANLNLLHSAFRVRTNEVFGKYTKDENYYYLSGLLIGYELKELLTKDYKKIVIVADDKLRDLYEIAFGILHKSNGPAPVEVQDAEEALIKGQFKIFMCHKSNSQ